MDNYGKCRSRSTALPLLIKHAAYDTSISSSCSISATNTVLSERVRVSPGVSHADQKDDRLENQTSCNTTQISSLSVADESMLGYLTSDNAGLTSSTQLIVVDFNDRTKNAANPKVGQELLQSSDDTDLLLTAANQFKSPDMIRGNQHDDIVLTESFRTESEASRKDESDRYEVERIVDHDEHNGWKRYLVKWSGWSADHMTWEPEGNLDECLDTIKEYWTSMRDLDAVGNTPASGYTERKRKKLQKDREFSNEDGDYVEGCQGVETGTEDSGGEGRKRRKKQCTGCRKTGHNYRTCPTVVVDINN